MPFPHLHTHSHFSFHAGTASVEQLVLRAKALGMDALALTDTDRMSGLILFYRLCVQHGIRPVLGVELTRPGTPHERVVVLVKNREGYGDMCELITRRHCECSGFSLEREVCAPQPNLVFMTDSPALLRVLAASPNRKDLFGELINQDPRTRARSREIERLCRELSLPCVVTNDVWFLDKKDFAVHQVLRAIGANATLSRLEPGEYAPANAFFRDTADMEALFPHHKEALGATRTIVGRCCCTLELGRWIMPRITTPDGTSPEAYLRRCAMEGLDRKYGADARYKEALALQEKELRVISSLGYASYFLMVKQIRDRANAAFAGGYRKPVDCTLMRGSAANSITFYTIGASDLDPLRYNLYFERFLNEERAGPPDADLDFAWDERDAVFDYFAEAWGEGNVAVTCTTNHFKRRAAFREVAKVFGYSEDQVSGFIENGVPDDDPELHTIRAYAEKIRGMPRFLGQHPGGILVTNEPIRRRVACERSGGLKNRIITQIDMHNGIDELGLIKFDMLGNGSLAVLRDTLAQLAEQGIPDPHVENDDMVRRDTATLELIRRGRTRGVFYIESPAQIKLNRKAMAQSFEEIGITSSAIRPAGTAYTRVFVERHRKMKQGIIDWDFLHPSLKPILAETHDCLVFQEDVIKVCREVAGMSFKRADRVRKMMNSLHEGVPHDYDAVAREFMHGCMSGTGMTPAQARELWTRVNSFAGFSFCKSHSLSYAQLSFKNAYLKSRYPAQFMAAVITNRHGFYSCDVYVNEARRLGVKVLPYDINRSRMSWYGTGMFLRPGLQQIQNATTAALRELLTERDRNGPFRHLVDFLQRVALGRGDTVRLIQCGCFDSFGMSRPELVALCDVVRGKTVPEQQNLFDPVREFRDTLHTPLPGYTRTRQCLDELAILGFMLSGNILDILDLHPAAKNAVPANEICRYVNRVVTVFGWPITARAHVIGGRGEMRFITMEDKTGSADIVLWPETYTRFREVVHRSGPFAIRGLVQEEYGTFCVIAHTVRDVAWSPAQVDFNRAEKRLLRSYSEAYVYDHVAGDAHARAA